MLTAGFFHVAAARGAIRVHTAEIPAVAPNMTYREVAGIATEKRASKRAAITITDFEVMWKERSQLASHEAHEWHQLALVVGRSVWLHSKTVLGKGVWPPEIMCSSQYTPCKIRITTLATASTSRASSCY